MDPLDISPPGAGGAWVHITAGSAQDAQRLAETLTDAYVVGPMETWPIPGADDAVRALLYVDVAGHSWDLLLPANGPG